MIPVRLNFRNFMCYTDVHEPLVFEGIHVACLSGDNGHGKSALLDAITWALWGKSRARSADELIHLAPNCTEMEVEFEFRLDGQQYRVIRKRSKRGRGQSLLDLAVWDGGSYRSLTGSSVSETERQIEQLLRMSYETFTNASFILQGKADSFTTKTPAERKQILAEILDLSFYDRLEERAKQRAAERAEQAAGLRQLIEEDDAELRQQSTLREQHSALEAALAAHEERLRLAEAQTAILRERLTRLEAGQRELAEQERRLAEARGRADRQRQLIAEAEAALARARAVLARRTEIERGYAELLERRQELERLTALQAEHTRLVQEAARLEQVIAQARGQLEGRREQLQRQIASGELETGRLGELEAELAAARAELDALDLQEQQRCELDKQLVATREQYAALRAHREQLGARLEELEQRRRLLGESSTCPVCQTPLGAERHRGVLERYRREAEQLVEQRRGIEQQLQDVERAGKSLRARLNELDLLPARRRACQERLAQAQQALARAQEQQRRLEELKSEVRRVETALAEEAYARAEQQDLALVRRQIAGLGYDAARLEAVSAAVAEHREYESLRRDLEEAARSVAREEAAKREAERALAEWAAEIGQAERRIAELRAETGDLERVQAELAAAETELREQRRESVRLNQELGAVRQRLSTMEFIAQRRKERLAELDRLLVERSIYQELAQAFGKKGLQAMLIETAIPEIQDEANRLLDLLTDGRMSVRFETQRAAKSGDTIETLDINISDERGTRAYELYSGGEAFRVNFAIRIALSKLLARRAGAKLQTLVIDEGVGALDTQGKDRLVEAIKAIQSEFEKILVITHLPELKDAFPVRIEVVKTPAGSLIQVT